jgi:hypothetical protein
MRGQALHSASLTATSSTESIKIRTGIMRAEIERLVEEIKQSVGLLRRHL